MLSVLWREKQKENERLVIILCILYQGWVLAVAGSGFMTPQWLSQACVLNRAEKGPIVGVGAPCAIGIH